MAGIRTLGTRVVRRGVGSERLRALVLASVFGFDAFLVVCFGRSRVDRVSAGASERLELTVRTLATSGPGPVA